MTCENLIREKDELSKRCEQYDLQIVEMQKTADAAIEQAVCLLSMFLSIANIVLDIVEYGYRCDMRKSKTRQ